VEREIAAASKWWRGCLEHPQSHENGDLYQSTFMTILSVKSHRNPTPEQLDAFEAALTRILRDDYKDRWYPEDHNRASYMRCIFNDYHADPRLAQACREAGIKCGMLTFPCKTRMGIDPGRVKVNGVYSGQPDQIIYSDAQPKEDAGA